MIKLPFLIHIISVTDICPSYLAFFWYSLSIIQNGKIYLPCWLINSPPSSCALSHCSTYCALLSKEKAVHAYSTLTYYLSSNILLYKLAYIYIYYIYYLFFHLTHFLICCSSTSCVCVHNKLCPVYSTFLLNTAFLSTTDPCMSYYI